MRNSFRNLLPLLFLVLLLTLLAWAQQAQTPPQTQTPAPHPIPLEAVHRPNPVKPTAESLALGKKMYGYDCAMCHGTNGDGKGDVAADMKTKVSDFADPATLKDATDGELFYIIKNGKGDMPPEGPRVKTEELWNLVNYVRSFAKKKTPEEKPQP
jgi:mono/diheme cytochrome c family protein